MKIKKSKHKKVKVILKNQLTDLFISHETEIDTDDGKSIFLVGWTELVKPMSLKNKTSIFILKDCVLFE